MQLTLTGYIVYYCTKSSSCCKVAQAMLMDFGHTKKNTYGLKQRASWPASPTRVSSPNGTYTCDTRKWHRGSNWIRFLLVSERWKNEILFDFCSVKASWVARPRGAHRQWKGIWVVVLRKDDNLNIFLQILHELLQLVWLDRWWHVDVETRWIFF